MHRRAGGFLRPFFLVRRPRYDPGMAPVIGCHENFMGQAASQRHIRRDACPGDHKAMAETGLNPDAGAAPPQMAELFSRLRSHRPSVLRRPCCADRADAQGTGRGARLAHRKAVPAGAQLLHAAAGPRGDAACHLCRLAHGGRGWRADRRAALRDPGGRGDPRTCRALRRLRERSIGRGAVPGGQGHRHRHRGPGASQARREGPVGPAGLGAGRGCVSRALRAATPPSR